jgi:hypothetical protein
MLRRSYFGCRATFELIRNASTNSEPGNRSIIADRKTGVGMRPCANRMAPGEAKPSFSTIDGIIMGRYRAGVARNHQEHNLPGQSYADETVEEFGMRNSRRVLQAEALFHEVEMRKNQQAPDARDREDPPGKFHSPYIHFRAITTGCI